MYVCEFIKRKEKQRRGERVKKIRNFFPHSYYTLLLYCLSSWPLSFIFYFLPFAVVPSSFFPAPMLPSLSLVAFNL